MDGLPGSPLDRKIITILPWGHPCGFFEPCPDERLVGEVKFPTDYLMAIGRLVEDSVSEKWAAFRGFQVLA